jgi:guanylate kinase
MSIEARIPSRGVRLVVSDGASVSVASASGFADHDPIGISADEAIADLRARRRPRVFVISGPSGVGKDTVIERLRDVFPDIHFAVTATTRPRRPGEIHGIHYYFLSKEEFNQRLNSGDFLESAVVYDHRYGVLKSPVQHAVNRGQDVIIKVDVQGAATIRELAPNGIFIFLAPESMSELLQRLKARKTDDPDVLMERFQAASRELASAFDFDYVVFNETEQVESAMDALCAIIQAERCKLEQAEVSL